MSASTVSAPAATSLAGRASSLPRPGPRSTVPCPRCRIAAVVIVREARPTPGRQQGMCESCGLALDRATDGAAGVVGVWVPLAPADAPAGGMAVDAGGEGTR